MTDREGSSEKVNYLIRPAKQVERKLIIEALQCLKQKYPIEHYQYIGMGSLYFVDYQMFHKHLGIDDMISMEKEEEKIERFEFNKPYNFIDIKPGISTDILPDLDWGKNMLIWLDYDDSLHKGMLNDIETVCNNIQQGGILIITVDAEPKRFSSKVIQSSKTVHEDRLINFKEKLHPHYPRKISSSDMVYKNFSALLYKIFLNKIKESIYINPNKFFQLFNFKYKDTSQMYTFGCVFDKSENEIETTGIYDLNFISKDSDIVEIKLPILTPREKIHFDKKIPRISERLKDFPMSRDKIETYEKYYKYYPQYFETFL